MLARTIPSMLLIITTECTISDYDDEQQQQQLKTS